MEVSSSLPCDVDYFAGVLRVEIWVLNDRGDHVRIQLYCLLAYVDHLVEMSVEQYLIRDELSKLCLVILFHFKQKHVPL